MGGREARGRGEDHRSEGLSPGTRAAALAALAVAALAAAGCTTAWTRVESAVILAPGDRAEGRLHPPPGERVAVAFKNVGRGRANFVIREAGGQVLQQGSLGEAVVEVLATEPEPLVVVLEAYEDAGATVRYALQASGPVRIEWELKPAAR